MAKNPGGRPTKYNEDMCQKVDEYIANTQDTYKELIKGKGVEQQLQVNRPTKYGLASFLGVNKTTLYERADKNPEFSNALEKIDEEQKRRLVEMGLSGEYNSTIAKLVLSANHGMSETKKIEQDIKLDANIDVSELTLKQLEEQRQKLLGE